MSQKFNKGRAVVSKKESVIKTSSDIEQDHKIAKRARRRGDGTVNIAMETFEKAQGSKSGRAEARRGEFPL